MKIEDLPRPANYRRQMAKNGGYEMVPAYTAEEVLGILEGVSAKKTGWRLVPVVPTKAMLDAALCLEADTDEAWDDEPAHSELYAAMIAASPKALAQPAPLTDAQKQDIHDRTGAGHALICLVESYIVEQIVLNLTIDAAIKKGQV